MRDLVILVPDKDIEQAIRGLLARPQALSIRSVSFEVRVHPNRDPGCYNTGHELLGVDARNSHHALMVFDRAWDGAPEPGRLMADVEGKLRPLWGDRACCVVIDPEIEAWAWSDSPHVARILGWRGTTRELRSWLESQGLWPAGSQKPSNPKLAFERTVRKANLPPSSSLFAQLAARVSFERCIDPAFGRLRSILREWFGTEVDSGPSDPGSE